MSSKKTPKEFLRDLPKAICFLLSMMAFFWTDNSISKEPAVHCKISNSKSLDKLTADSRWLSLNSPKKTKSLKFKVLKKSVQGVGESAIKSYAFKDGSLTFQSRYGCLENAKWNWTSEHRKNPLGDSVTLNCSQIGAPPCKAP